MSGRLTNTLTKFQFYNSSIKTKRQARDLSAKHISIL